MFKTIENLETKKGIIAYGEEGNKKVNKALISFNSQGSAVLAEPYDFTSFHTFLSYGITGSFEVKLMLDGQEVSHYSLEEARNYLDKNEDLSNIIERIHNQESKLSNPTVSSTDKRVASISLHTLYQQLDEDVAVAKLQK